MFRDLIIDATAHGVAASSEYASDPVHLYQRLITEHGVTKADEIWRAACAIADRNGGSDAA
jgi:hypothetical protein